MKAKLKSTRSILTDIAEKLTFVLHIEKQAEFWQKIWKEKNGEGCKWKNSWREIHRKLEVEVYFEYNSQKVDRLWVPVFTKIFISPSLPNDHLAGNDLALHGEGS